MMRKLLAIWLFLAPLVATGEIVHFDVTGQSRYVRFSDASSTAVNMTEGGTLLTGRYVATDAAIAAASLPAGTYTARIFAGTAGAQSGSDAQVGVVEGFKWDVNDAPKRWLAKFDGVARGNLPVTHTRNKATTDRNGRAVPIDAIRFAPEPRVAIGNVEWIDTGYDCGTTANLLATGDSAEVQPNGKPKRLSVLMDQTGSTLRILEIDDVNLAVKGELSRTAWSALPGAPTATYLPRSAAIGCGLIVVQAQTTIGGVIVGHTYFASQNEGVTWTRVPTVGGGLYMPAPAASSPAMDANPRGGQWGMRIFPVGGVDANGRFNTNDLMICWADYCIGQIGVHEPRLAQFGAFRATRPAPGLYTLGNNRELFSRYSASYASNLHGHAIGLTGDGVFIAANGDSNGKTAFHAIEIDLDEYETATPVVTEVFGELAASGTVGRLAPQMFGMVPAPGGDIIGGNDTWPSVGLRIRNMASATDRFDLESILWQERDSKTGNYFSGHENFVANCYLGADGVVKGYTIGGPANENVCRHLSLDGVNFGQMNNSDAVEEHHFIAGDCLIAVASSNETLMMARMPGVKALRPAEVASGANNYLTATSTDYSITPATSPNTRRVVRWDGSRTVFASDSTAVPNASPNPPPFPDPYGMWMGNESAATYLHGAGYLSDSGDNLTIGSGHVGVTMALENLGTKAVGHSSFKVGASGIGADCTAEQGHKPDASYGNRALVGTVWGNPANAASPSSIAAARQLIFWNSGPTGATANKENPVIVWLGGLYAGEQTPWPTPRDSTGNSHELLKVGVPAEVGNNWTITVGDLRSETQATLETSSPIATFYPSGTHYTIYVDAQNYITVALDGTNWEIDVTPTVANVAGSTTSVAIEDWPRGTPVIGSFSYDGRTLRCSFLTPRNGVQTASFAVALPRTPVDVRFSNAADSFVFNQMPAAVEVRNRALSFQQQRELLTTLDCLSTDDELTAATVAATVDAQLSNAFASVPADVWLQDLANIQKSGSTGRRLSRLPDADAGEEDGLPTVDANNRIEGMQGTLNTLDALDSAQDLQHTNTQGTLAIVAANAATAAANTVAGAIRNAIGLAAPNLDTQIDGIEGGGGGEVIPVNQIPVPLARTWVVTATEDGLASGPLTLKAGKSALFAVDFREDLPTNGRLKETESVAIATGTSGGVTFPADLADPEDAGVDKSQSKLRITGVTPGTYEIEVSAEHQTADGGGSSTARVTLNVIE